MNVKKIITVLLAVFLLTAVFCGAASAFTVQSEAVVPSGSLVAGERVAATVELKFPQGSVDTGSKVSFDTPLVGDTWVVDIIKAGTIVNTKHPASPYLYISGFDLEYEADIILRVAVTGTVSSDSASKEISVLQVTASGMHDAGMQSYSSPKQFVYNTGNLQGELAVLANAITTLDTRIANYIAYERDVGKAQSYTEQARSCYTAAQNAGTADAVTAFGNVEAGNGYVKKAQMELALTALSMALSYTTAVDDTITTLYSKGWNSEAKILDGKNVGLKNTYSQLLSTYNAGNVPDAGALDQLAADSLALWEEGNKYLESANNPLGGLLSILPFILIGVGVVVVGVVVFLLIRRRKNSWDELG
ncbi:MAG TPA: hypothetical protein O0X97_05945 [Methanocorpusculum sp.]|nr:hypothetical protein [Methanocorpusculum sp.]